MTSMSPERGGGTTLVHRACIPTTGLGIGAMVQTLKGLVPVEDLKPGDRLLAVDRGVVRLRALTRRAVDPAQLVHVAPRALTAIRGGDVYPAFTVAAYQPMVLRGWMAQAMFGKPRALVQARQLIDGELIRKVAGTTPLSLYQLHFDDVHFVRIGGMDMTSTHLPALKRSRADTI